MPIRVGTGYDIHRLQHGRRFVLGGVEIGCDSGPIGHSDADVLLHAVIDALLGAAAMGDIGGLFPSQEERWRGADSALLLAQVVALLDAAGWHVENVDSTVVTERPRLAGYLPEMRARIAAVLGVNQDSVSVKAKTNEGLDAVGEGLAIAAHVVVLITR